MSMRKLSSGEEVKTLQGKKKLERNGGREESQS